MTLRRKFALYLFLLHLIFAVVVTYLLWNQRLWLIGVEVLFFISFLIALRIFRGLFRPLELLSTGVSFMRDGDFSSRLRRSGQPEMDHLIDVYNQMMDKLRAERLRLQEQHFLLEKIIAASPGGIIILDFDDCIANANPAALKLLGMSLPELQRKKLHEVPDSLLNALSKLAEGESAIVPLRGTRRVRCQSSHFIDQGHRRTFFLIEELTEELRKNEKAAYEKVIRMLSHEVNNSIGAANSLLHSSLHYKDQLRPEDRHDFSTAINVAISRTEHLTAFMKSFADIIRLPLPRKQPTDVRSLLVGIQILVAPECSHRNINIQIEDHARIDPVSMDQHQMEQAFLNIIKNSMEAIGMDGKISIILGSQANRPFVSIEDSGTGITEETRKHLFTPFFSTKENGQGIGLTLVQEILTQHQFEFSLDSSPNHRTRFAIFLA